MENKTILYVNIIRDILNNKRDYLYTYICIRV